MLPRARKHNECTIVLSKQNQLHFMLFLEYLSNEYIISFNCMNKAKTIYVTFEVDKDMNNNHTDRCINYINANS